MRLLTPIFLLITFKIFAGDIKGLVIDKETNETLVAASVFLDGTNYHTITGLDGSFILNDVKEGEYTIKISYLGYEAFSQRILVSKTKQNIKLKLKPIKHTLSEAFIYARKKTQTEASARASEKRSEQVISVMSARAIELSPDLDLANVVNRISGVSLETDNTSSGETFSIIRGMSKRYNYSLINGIKIPSPDDKNRYVPLDIFPSELIGRVEVSKSLTADMESDAIGGTINMITKDAPEKLTININAAIGYNSLFFNKGFKTFDTDAIEETTPFQAYGYNYQATQSDFTTKNLEIINQKFSPNAFIASTIGNRFFNKKFGAVVSVSYNNQNKGSESLRLESDLLPGTTLPKLTKMSDRAYYSNLKQTGMHTKLDYVLSNRHTLKLYGALFNLEGTQIREKTDVSILGSNNLFDSKRRTYETRYINKKHRIYNTTLLGEHQLAPNHSINWAIASSFARKDVPDEAYFVRISNYTLVEDVESILIAEDGDNKRIWRFNKDRDYSGKLDYLFKFKTKYLDSKIKLGGLYRTKYRFSFINSYNFDPSPAIQAYGNDWQPGDSYEGVSYGTWEDYSDVQFKVNNPGGSTTTALNHKFYSNYTGAYIQFSSIFKKRIHFSAGIRYEKEDWSYKLLAPRPGQESKGERNFADFFPNIHLKYELTEKSNIRSSYFHSTVRPGFFEILPYSEKDEDNYLQIGNPDVKATYAHNWDLRYENFFTSTDKFMIGTFYKNIINPIEYAVYGSNETWFDSNGKTKMPDNFGTAINWGIELDFIKYIRMFGLRLNYTYTNSKITQSKQFKQRKDPNNINSEIETISVKQTRPMQGQADHIGNIALLYKNQDKGIDAQISLVYTGERIKNISNYLDNDEWENPYYKLDFSFQKKIQKWTVFFKVKNILNTPYMVVIKQGLREENVDFPLQGDLGDNYIIRRDYYSRSFRLGIKYSF